MTSQELTALIEERTEAIWLDEPRDVARMRRGVIPSGAGSYGQYFTTLLYAQSETRGLVLHAVASLLKLAADPSFSIQQLKVIARETFTTRAGFLDYLGLTELGHLMRAYFDVLNDIEDRQELIRLTSALKTYGARLHLWTLHVFPWYLGMDMARVTEEEATQVLADLQEGGYPLIPYATT